MKMKEDVDAEVPWPPLRPWVPSWRFRKCAHSPGSDIGCRRAPESPLHAVSPGCGWPARPPPQLSPLQSHLHPPPNSGGPTRGRQTPLHPSSTAGRKAALGDLHFYENQASGATPPRGRRGASGMAFGLCPSPLPGARSPRPLPLRPPAPPPAPILCPALISA